MKSKPVIKEPNAELVFLIEQAREGDRDAFDRLIGLFEKNVMKTALYLTGNLADAQDVAQEVYIKIFRHIGSARQTEGIEGWVYRITVNAAHDWHRKKRPWEPLKNLFFAPAERDPVLEHELKGRLLRALGKLTFQERVCFVSKELKEMETSEVARALGCSEVTVRGHLHSGRRKLQRYFQDFWEE